MAASKPSDLTLGNFLKIVSKGLVYNNLSTDSAVWENIARKKKGASEGRHLRYLLRSKLGAGAVGFVKPTGADYPTSHQATINEATAEYKDFALTVEVERTLMEKAYNDFNSYGDVLAEELTAKGIAMSRMLSASVYGDGTGVVAQALDAGTADTSTDLVTFNVDTTTSARGFIGWVEIGDKLLPKNADGTAAAPTCTDFSYYIVTAKDRDNGTITLQPTNSSDAAVTDLTATGLTAGDLLYRQTQSTFSDISSAPAVDYNTLSENWAGLASLSENDGRLVNGITQSGNLGGTRRDASGDPIDSQDFQQIISKLMIAVGAGRYNYKQAMMAWETLDSLIEAREVDRRFQSIEDNKRGVKSIGYIHGRNSVMFEADEYCPKQRIYVIPDGEACSFHGKDFEYVEATPGQKFYLKASSNGGYSRSINAFMEGSGVLVSNHMAAIGTIENFTVTS
jgi:hypothetical protein